MHHQSRKQLKNYQECLGLWFCLFPLSPTSGTKCSCQPLRSAAGNAFSAPNAGCIPFSQLWQDLHSFQGLCVGSHGGHVKCKSKYNWQMTAIDTQLVSSSLNERMDEKRKDFALFQLAPSWSCVLLVVRPMVHSALHFCSRWLQVEPRMDQISSFRLGYHVFFSCYSHVWLDLPCCE